MDEAQLGRARRARAELLEKLTGLEGFGAVGLALLDDHYHVKVLVDPGSPAAAKVPARLHGVSVIQARRPHYRVG